MIYRIKAHVKALNKYWSVLCLLGDFLPHWFPHYTVHGTCHSVFIRSEVTCACCSTALSAACTSLLSRRSTATHDRPISQRFLPVRSGQRQLLWAMAVLLKLNSGKYRRKVIGRDDNPPPWHCYLRRVCIFVSVCALWSLTFPKIP